MYWLWGAGEVRRFDFAASELQKIRTRDASMASVMGSDRIPKFRNDKLAGGPTDLLTPPN